MRAMLLFTVGLFLVLPAVTTATPPDDVDSWSKPTHGLQARITLIEKPKSNGTRSIVPYLELRNVSDSADPTKVRCGSGQVKFELVDADGKIVRDGWTLPRSGPHPDPGIVVLPYDSSMRIGMHCSNWGVPKDAAAMISTDSGAWVIQPQEKGKVFLRATIKGGKVEADSDRTWQGAIEISALKVDWADDAAKASRTIDGKKVQYPARSLTKGVKTTIGVLESCTAPRKVRTSPPN